MSYAKLVDICLEINHDTPIEGRTLAKKIKTFIFNRMPPGLVTIDQTSFKGYNKGDTFEVIDAVKIKTGKAKNRERFIVKRNDGKRMLVPVNDIDWERAIIRLYNRYKAQEKTESCQIKSG